MLDKLFLLLVSSGIIVTQGNEDTINFYYSKKETKYALKAQKIEIQCGMNTSSPEKQTKWFYNSSIPVNSSNSVVANSKLIFESVQFTDSGSYHCALIEHASSNEIFISRSFATYLHVIAWPKFVLKSLYVNMNGNTFFKCIQQDFPLIKDNRFHISWHHNGENVVMGEYFLPMHNILIVRNVTKNNAGLYHCLIRYDDHVKSSYQVNLSISATAKKYDKFPLVEYLSESQQLISSEKLNFLCIGSPSNVVVHFVKLKDHSSKINVGSKMIGFATYFKNAVDVSDGGLYKCQVENQVGSFEKDIFLSVEEKLKLLSNKTFETYIGMSGDIFNLSCLANQIANISWYFNGEKLEERGSTLSITHIDFQQIGIYECVVQTTLQMIMRRWKVILKDIYDRPENLQAIVNRSTILLKWEKPVNTNKNIFYEITQHTQPFIRTFTYSTKKLKKKIRNLLYGFTYTFKVCSKSTVDKSLHACSSKTLTLPYDKLEKPPVILSTSVDKKKMFISWHPTHLLHGIVDKVTIYYQLVYTYYAIVEEVFHADIFNISIDHTEIILPRYGLYRIWMTAQNKVSHSPKSSIHLVYVEQDSDIISCNAVWDGNRIQLSWRLSNNINILGVMIYVTSFPYTNFWKSTSAYRMFRNETQLFLYDKYVRYKYRITFAAIVESHLKHYGVFQVLKTPYKYVTLTSTQHPTNNLLCFPVRYDQILFAWKNYSHATTYAITILNEDDKNMIYLRKHGSYYLYPSHHLWVHANVDVYKNNVKPRELFSKNFISCPSFLEPPTLVQNLSYSAINERHSNTMYLILRWKEPVYTGGCLFMYYINYTGFRYKPALRLHAAFHTLIVDKEQKRIGDKGFVYSRPMVVSLNLRYEVSVYASNCAGESQPSTILTSRMHGIKNAGDSRANHLNGSNKNINIGLVIGLTASIFLIIILIALYASNDLCFCTCINSSYTGENNRRERQNNNSESQPFIYLHELEDISQINATTSNETLEKNSKNNSIFTTLDSLKELASSCVPQQAMKKGHRLNNRAGSTRNNSSSNSSTCSSVQMYSQVSRPTSSSFQT